MSDLTPEQTERVEKALVDLRSRGYVDINEHGRLRPGVRIRHRGDQYSEAYQNGTGVVIAITEKPNSAWSASWRMPDIELLVLWDKEHRGIDRISQLAQYHVSVIEQDEVAS
jgi:hypothetical protein